MILLMNSLLFSITHTGPSVLSPGDIVLGIAAQIALNQYWGAFAVNEFGLLNDFNSIIHIGYVGEEDNNFYVSGGVKYLIADNFGGTDNISILLGGHYSGVVGFDAALLIGNKFQGFEAYFGFDFSYNNTEEPTYPCDFLVGTSFNVFSDNDLDIEIGIPVTSDSDYKIGSSLRFNL